jgi:LysR family transcriptional activator of nhaA
METGVILMAAPTLAENLRGSFPEPLSGFPLLVPTERAAMRREIDRWTDQHRLHPLVVGEFDDFALMGVFAQAGIGALAVPAVIAQEAGLEFDLSPVASLDGIR